MAHNQSSKQQSKLPLTSESQQHQDSPAEVARAFNKMALVAKAFRETENLPEEEVKYSKEDLQKIKLPLSRKTFLSLKDDKDLQEMYKLWPEELKDAYHEEYRKYMEETYPQYWND